MATGQNIKGRLVHLTQQQDNSGLEGAGNTINTTVAVSSMAWYKTPYTSWTLRKSTWWHLNRKDSPYFGCQRAHQAERAPHRAFEFQQFPAQLDALEHTGLLHPWCSSKHIQPSLLPKGSHSTPGPVGCSSQTSVDIPAGMGTPRAALDKLLKIQGLFKEKPVTIRKEMFLLLLFHPIFLCSCVTNLQFPFLLPIHRRGRI